LFPPSSSTSLACTLCLRLGFDEAARLSLSHVRELNLGLGFAEVALLSLSHSLTLSLSLPHPFLPLPLPLHLSLYIGTPWNGTDPYHAKLVIGVIHTMPNQLVANTPSDTSSVNLFKLCYQTIMDHYNVSKWHYY